MYILIIAFIVIAVILFRVWKKYKPVIINKFKNLMNPNKAKKVQINENLNKEKIIEDIEESTSLSQYDNNVIMIHRDGCPYSDKMKQLLEEENMKMNNLDVVIKLLTEPEGRKIANKYDITGTPGFILTKDNKTSLGYQPVANHVEKLFGIKPKVEPLNLDKYKNKVIFLHRDGCPYSENANDLLNNLNYKLNDIDVITLQISSSDGSQIAQKYGVDGTPGFVNLINDKMTMGLTSIEELIVDLGLSKSDSSEQQLPATVVAEENFVDLSSGGVNDRREEDIEKIESKIIKEETIPEKLHSDSPEDMTVPQGHGSREDKVVANEQPLIVVGKDNCYFTESLLKLLNEKIDKKKFVFMNSDDEQAQHIIKQLEPTSYPIVINPNNNKVQFGFNENILEEIEFI